MSWVSKAYREIRASVTTYIDSKTRAYMFNVGPEPDLNPRAILAELNGDRLLRSKDFVIGGKSLRSNAYAAYTHTPMQKKSIATIQKGLIALGLIKVDRSEKEWWRIPKQPYNDSVGGFGWGEYGARTVKAVDEFQKLAGIFGNAGNIFDHDTLKAFKKALEALAEGRDWREEIKPPVQPNANDQLI